MQNFNNISKKIFINLTTNAVNWQHNKINQLPVKSLWNYVATSFNHVDTDRLMDVGADRLCAEWVIKNGGAIRSAEASNLVYSDYNSLPPENHTFNVKVVDCSDSSIMKVGFDHLKGCHHIDTVILHTCKNLEKDGLLGLAQLKDTLKVLQVSDCDNIRDEGLVSLGQLSKLQELKIFEMRYVQDWNNVKQKLSGMLPKCHIDIRE